MQNQSVWELIKNKEITSAIDFLMLELEEGRHNTRPFIGLGTIEEQQGYYKSYVLEWLLEETQFDQLSLFDILSICLTISRDNNAQQWYKKMIALNPSRHQFLFGLANIYYNSGRHREAIQHYDLSLKLDSTLHRAHQHKAFIFYFHLSHEKQAEEQLQKGLAINPNNLHLRFLRIIIKQPIEQQNQLLKVLYSQNPRYIRILNNIGKNLLLMEKVSEAVPHFEECIRLDPYYSTPYFNLGLIFEKNKQIAKSISYHQKSFELDPTFTYCKIVIGRLHYEYFDQYVEAEAYFRQVLQLQATNISALFSMARMNNHRKTFEEAEYWLKKCIEIEQRDYLFSSLGAVYENKRQLQNAIQSYEKAIKLNPNSLVSLSSLAQIHHALGHFDKSAYYYEDLRSPRHNFIISEKGYQNHAKNLLNAGKKSEAVMLLKEAIKTYPKKLIFYTTLGGLLLREQAVSAAEEMFDAARLKYLENKSQYDSTNCEEEAVQQIKSYCGFMDGLTYNRMGTISLKMAVILQKHKHHFGKNFQEIFEGEDNLY